MTPPAPAPAGPVRGQRPYVTRRLNAWWLVAAGILAALGFVATDHMWRATGTLVLTLVVAAVLRVVLPIEGAGGLVVRRTIVDVAILAFFAVVVGVTGFSLDLTALP